MHYMMTYIAMYRMSCPQSIVYHQNFPNRSVIDVVTSNKNLGVLFGQNMNFYSRIKTIWCRAFKMFGFIIHTLKEFKLSASLKTMYCSFVHNYAVVLWDSSTVADSSHLERVQRRFLSSAAYILKITYPSARLSPSNA